MAKNERNGLCSSCWLLKIHLWANFECLPQNLKVISWKQFLEHNILLEFYRCKEMPNCGSTNVNSQCFCSGMWGPYDLLIVDTVQIPKNLTPGDYVVGFRWDCEESTQVWSSCADVKIEN